MRENWIILVFTSRKLSKVEKNYFTTKREGLAMVYALQKFRHYLFGRQFKMYMDNSVLKYLVKNPVLGGKYVGGYYYSRSTTLK